MCYVVRKRECFIRNNCNTIKLSEWLPLNNSFFDQITGAGHGIGRELAILFAKQNAILVCWDLDEKGNEETKQMLKIKGHQRVYTYK